MGRLDFFCFFGSVYAYPSVLRIADLAVRTQSAGQPGGDGRLEEAIAWAAGRHPAQS